MATFVGGDDDRSGFVNLTFDDTGPFLKYAGFWNHGTWNASHTGQTGTLSTSNVPFDANVTFVFPEPAIGFYYYGILRSRGGKYGVCIDCDQNGYRFETMDAVNTTDDGGNPPVLLFSKRFETPGVHRIIIRNEPDDRFPRNNSQITIDRFELEIPARRSIVTIMPPNPSFTSSFFDQSKGKPIKLGAIIGGVVGALVALLIATGFLGCWWLKRRRAQTALSDLVTPLPHPTTSIAHSPITINTSALRTAHGKSRPTPTSATLTSPASQYTHSHPHHGSSHWPGNSSSSNPPQSTTMTTATWIREVDAGPVNRDQDTDVDGRDVLPPEYEQVFQPERMSTSSTTVLPVQDGPAGSTAQTTTPSPTLGVVSPQAIRTSESTDGVFFLPPVASGTVISDIVLDIR